MDELCSPPPPPTSYVETQPRIWLYLVRDWAFMEAIKGK